MHPKLFIFCIGGTGARVMKALTFLMASGVEIDASMIVPIIIDPDRENGDVQRTCDTLKLYDKIRSGLEFEQNSFFKTEIRTLNSLKGDGATSHEFRMDIDGTRAGHFIDFIDLAGMNDANRTMIKLLFSETNLNLPLDVGFKGNPHMGSIVLNQFEKSAEFEYFASRFSAGDRILIIGSIFGGTGAAGIPLLVKTIREANESTPNFNLLQNAPVSVLTIKPYFRVQKSKSSVIDSNSFISKTKSALEYYENYLSGNHSVNIQYYVGDTEVKPYKNEEGGSRQTNNAHFIELISALAAIDFMKTENMSLSCQNGKAKHTFFREYGINDLAENPVTIEILGPKSKKWIYKPLTSYALANLYWNQQLKSSILKNDNWTGAGQQKITMKFLDGDFYSRYFSPFNDDFKKWLEEMEDNSRGFSPYNNGTNLLHTIVKGFTVRKKTIFGNTKEVSLAFNDFHHYLSDAEQKTPVPDIDKKFMAIFSKASNKFVDDYFDQ